MLNCPSSLRTNSVLVRIQCTDRFHLLSEANVLRYEGKRPYAGYTLVVNDIVRLSGNLTLGPWQEIMRLLLLISSANDSSLSCYLLYDKGHCCCDV